MATIESSSRKIADINSTIDGIAFQTNILALNAAVEAARAGEQGRGFAVVASEVRSLAQRSAAAAKEIKQLIQESVTEVGEGARLVDDAGRTMQEIVVAVQRVAEIMSEINAASNEQSAGIGQVNQAVSQMDHVTQQNAALVEEVAAAAENLRSQMRVVSDAMGAFRLAKAAVSPTVRRRIAAPTSKRAKPVTQLPAKRARAQPLAVPAAAKTGTDDDWTEF
jgi:methyl-accepting chemotaxis protein